MSETLVDEALVLDRVPYGDHDLVTALLTRNNGRASLFARGARRRRPRFGAALDLHCLVEAEWRPPRAGTLGVLVRADLLDDHRTLRGDLDGLLLASFAAEAIKETCPEGEPVPSVFALQAALLARLCRSPTEPAAAPTRTWPSLWIAFQIKLLGLLGYAPQLERCAACGAPAPPGKSVLVEMARGGICCRTCREGASTGHLLRSPALAALRRLRDLPLGAEDLPQLGATELEQLRPLLPRALEQLTGRPLKSLPLLRF